MPVGMDSSERELQRTCAPHGRAGCLGQKHHDVRQPDSVGPQQRKFNVFAEEFNNEPLHEALDQDTPALADRLQRANPEERCFESPDWMSIGELANPLHQSSRGRRSEASFAIAGVRVL
jgi:hypothetical protein